MALYWDAQRLIQHMPATDESLRSRVFAAHWINQDKHRLYALICEATKWSKVLSQVIEESGILIEKHLTPVIAVLACYDFLVSEHGLQVGKNNRLKICFNKYSARLKSAFNRIRVRERQPTIQGWRSSINEQIMNRKLIVHGPGEGQIHFEHPRWIRLNFLMTTLEWECQHGALQGFQEIRDVQELLHKYRANDKVFARDAHVPDLVVIPPAHNLTQHPSYEAGRIIFQDKASCFPATLLNPQAVEGNIVDACAAPGNKTSHIAAVLQRNCLITPSPTRYLPMQQIYALEICPHRAETLKKMIKKHVGQHVEVRCIHNNFLKFGHYDGSEEIGAILVDPSCTGSGIIGREGDLVTEPELYLPRYPAHNTPRGADQAGRLKRKRSAKGECDDVEDIGRGRPNLKEQYDLKFTSLNMESKENPEPPLQRLENLAEIQVQLLLKAFRFENVHKIVYSTCSVHAEENEFVVLSVLYERGLINDGWMIQPRNQQVEGMREWNRRGDLNQVRRWFGGFGGQEGSGDEHVHDKGYYDDQKLSYGFSDETARAFADSCLRCEKWTDEGTQGFFAVMLVKRRPNLLGSWRVVGGTGAHVEPGLPMGNVPGTLTEGEIESDWERFDGFDDRDLEDGDMDGDVF